MKYFKPELLSRYRSPDDDTAETAAAEWEQATEAYRQHIDKVFDVLPEGVRQIISNHTLHDAKVQSISVGEKQPFLSLQICLEGTPAHPGDVLDLNYDVALGQHAGVLLPGRSDERAGVPSRWVILYNEFDVMDDGVCSHSILFDGGFELTVRFHAMHVRRIKKVISRLEDLPAIQQACTAVG